MILTCSQGCQLLNWIETVVPKLWFWFSKFPKLGSPQSNSEAQGISLSLCPPLHLGTFLLHVGQPAYLSASGAPDNGPLIKCRNNPFPPRETPEPQCPHIPQVRPSCSLAGEVLPGHEEYNMQHWTGLSSLTKHCTGDFIMYSHD